MVRFRMSHPEYRSGRLPSLELLRPNYQTVVARAVGLELPVNKVDVGDFEGLNFLKAKDVLSPDIFFLSLSLSPSLYIYIYIYLIYMNCIHICFYHIFLLAPEFLTLHLCEWQAVLDAMRANASNSTIQDPLLIPTWLGMGLDALFITSPIGPCTHNGLCHLVWPWYNS